MQQGNRSKGWATSVGPLAVINFDLITFHRLLIHLQLLCIQVHWLSELPSLEVVC